MTEPFDAIVVGAGPAGLATGRELARRGLRYVVLERGPQVGHSWANYYDSLTLHTGRRMSALPGRRFPSGTPVFIPRERFLAYLRDYADGCGVQVRTAWQVDRAEPVTDADGARWRVHGNGGELRARALVFATGIAASPRRPPLPGEGDFCGEILHSSEYRRPGAYVGKRVLIVGVGNSGGEIASELASAGATVSVAVRSGANVVPREIAGVPIQYVAHWIRKLPRGWQERIVALVARIIERRQGPPVLPRSAHGPLDAIPIIGFNLTDAIRAGRVAVRPGIERLTKDGARFVDGREEPYDVVILATGFTAALAPLRGLVRTDAKGFAVRADRVTSADQPRLWFVGHNYDATGGLHNIAHDAPIAAAAIARELGRSR
jgi:cation diffusion facilitator CzcD-associated flavoprotein CzcO